MVSESVRVPSGDAALAGDLVIPAGARGVVVFAHGSGSSRLSPRNRAVAEELQRAGLGTLLLDLLTEHEDREDAVTGEHRFDIALLARRLVDAIDWLQQRPDTADLPVGLFGASTGAAAALVAAAERPRSVSAVVSRGGRPDLADAALPQVRAPVLLIVGGDDEIVLDLNRKAAEALSARNATHVVPGATHLFPEPGALAQVSAAATDWFRDHLHRRDGGGPAG
ncbi:dienelactone hydrolase family protein [Streptomyces sp. TRM S81-3]|uniref:Dienelactone hydrolase family protein n=1 Tax=Streptomyces griseicoloratus TaxID=2752516 RepID=A0A926L8E5_9ACTN|nr:dienelactone hydrolase family protein [Streptomyces griseicoloratus]MBD0424547.1 dienelactone hydrolase family protein [Streptomyces griseicoloratus]